MEGNPEREKEAYPNAATGPNFLSFAHKLIEGVVRDQARVPVRVKLDQIAKVLYYFLQIKTRQGPLP